MLTWAVVAVGVGTFHPVPVMSCIRCKDDNLVSSPLLF